MTGGDERPPDSAGFRFPRARRVTRGADLDRLRQEGRRVRTGHLDVRVAPGDGPCRVGIVVPKHRHGSVERNTVKRRLRELARLRLLPLVPSGAVLLRARPEAYRASFAALARDVERAAREAAKLAVRDSPSGRPASTARAAAAPDERGADAGAPEPPPQG